MTFTSKVEGAAMGSPYHQLWPTSTCRTLSRGRWQQPHWSPHCGYAMWMTPLPSWNMVTGSCKVSLSIWMVNAQKSYSRWRRPKDQFLSLMSMWKRMEANWPSCVQETHPHEPLPPLQLTPPSKGEVWHCRLPPSQSWTDMPTGICLGRWKN